MAQGSGTSGGRVGAVQLEYQQLDNSQLHSILQTLGERVPPFSRLSLAGGSALVLLGSPRLTLDIDFVDDDVSPSELGNTIMKVGKELKIPIDAVPIHRFIPLPAGSDERHIRIGQFGNLEVFVTDPYSISLSKLDRGFDTDLDDIVFLIRNGYVVMSELSRMAQAVLLQAHEFDINGSDFMAHLQIVRERLR